MADGSPSQISNPFSTGGGGVNFEVHVQACFVALMLAGGYAPCLPLRPIRKIKLQGRHADYETDDVIIFAGSPNGSDQYKLLGQIRRSITLSAGNQDFGKVLSAAWRDYNNERVFAQGRDAIALITGPLSSSTINDVRELLDQARRHESPEEFLGNVEQAHFSSRAKREALSAFRTQLNAAAGKELSDNELVGFLKHFHLLGYDLDVGSGMMHAILHSLVGRDSSGDASGLWARIVEEVMSANQSAGTLSRESLPDDLVAAFDTPQTRHMPADVARTVAPANPKRWDELEYAPDLVVASLLGGWADGSEADKAVISQLTKCRYEAWLKSMREIVQLADGPLHHHNRQWTVRKRTELWTATGHRIFDEDLDLFSKCATHVLSEPDPRFELDQDKRHAAAIFGRVFDHSRPLRNGLAETLALLGTRPEPLTHCSTGKPEATAVLTVRSILQGADWVRWGSLNHVLPSLAEAAPDTFLEAVDRALTADPCPYDRLFAEEGNGMFGRNYMTGLLWALEGIAWEEGYLVRAVVALGGLAERDPGGSWANRPMNSLVTILLPWMPQTMAPIEKREVAVRTLIHECPDIAWRLLLTLLPERTGASMGSHKPKWRDVIPPDWPESVTPQDYWRQVSTYADLAIDIALTDASRCMDLVRHLGNVPEPAFGKLLTHIQSGAFAGQASREQQTRAWEVLTELVRKHRRFPDADWAMPEQDISRVEATAQVIKPADPRALYRRLFQNRTMELYDNDDDWEVQERKLAERRKRAVESVLNAHGVEGLMQFADDVESAGQLGVALGALRNRDVEARILPGMLITEDQRHEELARGYVRGVFHDSGWSGIESLDMTSWRKADIGRLLAHLPFEKATWQRAATLLGDDEGEYWRRTPAFARPGDPGLNDAVEKLIEHGRPHPAVGCLAGMLYATQKVDADQAVRALLSAPSSTEGQSTLDPHSTARVIQALQSDATVSAEQLLKIEWAYLPLLNGRHGARATHMETRMASDPQFFCELIRFVFRSEKEGESEPAPSEEQRTHAARVYELLREWRTVPGTQTDEHFDANAFEEWIEAVTDSSAKSGHLKVALQKAGAVLIHAPPDPDGLWMHRAIAKVLNEQDMHELRRGYELAVLNSRGVHYVDPQGKPEKEFATKYRAQAKDIEDADYHRVAATLRGIADWYDRQAERVIAEARSTQDSEDGG